MPWHHFLVLLGSHFPQQSELQRVDSNLLGARKEFYAATNTSTEKSGAVAAMQAELAALTAEIATLTTEVETVTMEKAAALQAKEDAIQQAVEFGVSGGARPAPAAAPVAAATSVPSGYAFQQPPPAQQQQQQQQQQFQQPP